MTMLEIKGYRNITNGKLKQKWGTLTDGDLYFTKGPPDGVVPNSKDLRMPPQ